MKNKKLNKIVFIIILCLFTITFFSCKKSEVIEKVYIDEEEIFNQVENIYLVIFTNNNEDGIEYVDKYCLDTNRKKLEYPVYIVKLDDNSPIYRTYSGLDGQGEDNRFYVDGVNEYEDLYIAELPAVIKVSDSTKYICSKDQTKAYFDGLITPYEISYDLNGGSFSGEEDGDIEEFSDPSEFDMPYPVKKGYIFLKFEENGKEVNKLESRNYELEAKWAETFEYEVIEDTEVLNRPDDRYLVYVMKDNCQYCDKAKNFVLRYIYLQQNEYKNAPKLYVVNITGSKIFNKSTPTLMEVYKDKDSSQENNDKQSNDIAVGTTNVKNKLNEILHSGNGKYEITVNYKVNEGSQEISDKKIYTFNEWETPVLPNYEVDGYMLLGYEHNGKWIKDLQKTNYEIDAVFVKSTYDTISDKDVFNQKESKYLIYFMKDGCSYCDKIKQEVNEYIYLQSKEEYNKSLKLYVVNLKTKDYTSDIHKPKGYTDDNIDGVTDVNELYVSSTPTLIEVENKKATLIEIGSSNIVKALDNYLVNANEIFNNKKFEITFDLNYNSNESIPSKKFYEWQTVTTFPKPIREGYIFMGWTYNDEVVTSFSGGSGKLVAKWVSSESYQLIKDSDIFNQKENRYLVFFMKDGCTYCERIEKDIIEYGINRLEDKYKNSLNLYIVNLKTGGYVSPVITKNKYDEEHINGVTDYLDLYIPSTPTLVEIYMENGKSTAKKVASGSSKVVSALDDYLVKNGDYVGEKKSYEISLDYGYNLDDPSNENNTNINNTIEKYVKYENSSFTLPVPVRDGYIFVGWEDKENKEIIVEIENKNYNLKALWKGLDDVKFIKDEEVFLQNDSEYYVLFVEKGSNTYKTILEIALKYQYKQDIEIPLYVIDVKDSIIKRAYNDGGEGYNNKFFVTGCKNWDELYIYATPSMIKVTNDGVLTVKYLNCHLKDVRSFLENLLK